MCEIETPKLKECIAYDIYYDSMRRRIKYCLNGGIEDDKIDVLNRNICNFWEDMCPENIPAPKPEDIYISKYENNQKYQFKLEVTYYKENEGNLPHNCYGFEIDLFCDTEQKLLDFIVESFKEDEAILYTNPEYILDNLKQRYRYETIYEIEHIEPDEDGEDNPLYDCEDCPVCMDAFSYKVENVTIEDINKRKRNTFCGHPVCYECFETIAKSDNKTCPICRADYEEYDIVCDEYEKSIEVDYIIGLQEDGYRTSFHQLLKITNLDDLALDCVRVDGYSHLIGFEWENWDSGNYVFATFPN